MMWRGADNRPTLPCMEGGEGWVLVAMALGALLPLWERWKGYREWKRGEYDINRHLPPRAAAHDATPAAPQHPTRLHDAPTAAPYGPPALPSDPPAPHLWAREDTSARAD